MKKTLCILTSLLLIGCDKPAEQPATQPTPEQGSADVQEGSAIPVAAPESKANVLESSGHGDIRVGMTTDDVAAKGYTVTITQPPFDEGSTCAYAKIEGLEGLSVMLDGKKIVRFDVDNTADGKPLAHNWQSTGGATIGSSHADLKRIYGETIAFEPHRYTGPEGQYAIVRDRDGKTGTVFETDGKSVERWRTGLWEEVQWVEGCA